MKRRSPENDVPDDVYNILYMIYSMMMTKDKRRRMTGLTLTWCDIYYIVTITYCMYRVSTVDLKVFLQCTVYSLHFKNILHFTFYKIKILYIIKIKLIII